MKKKYYLCIGLREDEVLAWKINFSIGQIYEEHKPVNDPKMLILELPKNITSRKPRYYVDASQFIKIDPDSIRARALDAYNNMEDEFFMLELFNFYQVKHVPRQTFQGSISRELRYLRELGVIDYKCVQNKQAYYHKLK